MCKLLGWLGQTVSCVSFTRVIPVQRWDRGVCSDSPLGWFLAGLITPRLGSSPTSGPFLFMFVHPGSPSARTSQFSLDPLVLSSHPLQGLGTHVLPASELWPASATRDETIVTADGFAQVLPKDKREAPGGCGGSARW